MNKFAEHVRKLLWVLGLSWIYHTAEKYLEHSESPSCLKRADHIRKAARVFQLNDTFPEIFNELQTCPQCEQFSLVLVHPNMICDSCWIEAMRVVQEYVREGVRALKEGVPLEEVLASANERLANDPKTR